MLDCTLYAVRRNVRVPFSKFWNFGPRIPESARQSRCPFVESCATTFSVTHTLRFNRCFPAHHETCYHRGGMCFVFRESSRLISDHTECGSRLFSSLPSASLNRSASGSTETSFPLRDLFISSLLRDCSSDDRVLPKRAYPLFLTFSRAESTTPSATAVSLL